MSDTVLEIAAVPRLVRLRAMGRLGVRMMFHDRLKFIGTISGVVFAVLLAVQQLSLSLIHILTLPTNREV